MKVNEYLHFFVHSLNAAYDEALSDLSEAQAYYLPTPNACHVVWQAWHWSRSEDNVLNFVCQERKPPVWVRQGLAEQWGLPRVEQGTGMDLAVAQGLRVPSLDALRRYIRDVAADVEPYVAGLSDADLQAVTLVRPFGERPKLQHIGQIVIAHGNGHLGQIMALRMLQGLKGDAF